MIHHVEVQVLILLLIASLVGMFARRVRLPYTLALVLAGLGLSLVRLGALRDLALTPDLLLLLFLPPLLFEAAYHLPFEDLRRNGPHIAFLAIFGVLASVGLTGLGAFVLFGRLGLVDGFGWMDAFLFASVIAATDPISVLALFKELGAPKRLYQIVEGESLINDGIAVVVFAILSAVFGLSSRDGQAVPVHGVEEIAAFAVVTFVKTGLGGVLVGAVAGGLVSVLTRQVDDHLIEITFTTLAAWGSFLLAEEIHVSGVLSTVSAGIVMGSFGKRFGMSASTRVAVQDFWQYMGFVSNSFIFLMLGLELEPAAFWRSAPLISLAFCVVVAARAILVYAGVPLVDRSSDPLPRCWRHVLVWGGLRGSLSMVLVLGLPAELAGRGFLINLVFGVVAISLFLQGLTMAPLMRRLGITTDASLIDREYDVARGRALAYREVLREGERHLSQGMLDEVMYRRLLAYYRQARERARRVALEHAGASTRPEQLLQAARALALIEREELNRVAHSGLMTESVCGELLAEVDARLESLANAAGENEQELREALDRLYPIREVTADGDPRSRAKCQTATTGPDCHDDRARR